MTTNTPRRCAFCGGRPLTREHIWADWLKQYIPRTMSSYESYSAIQHRTHIEENIQKISGDPHSWRVRCVCKLCNERWMSRIQEDAKSIAVTLLSGNKTTLKREDQRIITMWIAMAVICGEFSNRKTVTTTACGRLWLKELRMLPPYWRIWIGYYKRKTWIPHWIHNPFLVSEKHVPDAALGNWASYNTQTTTYVVGQLFIHAFSSIDGQLVRQRRFPKFFKNRLRQLWPLTGLNISWPPPEIISDTQADFIAGSFYSAARRAGLRRNGDP